MSKKISTKSLSLQTILAGEGHQLPVEKPHSLPIYSTSSFEVGSLDDSISLFNGDKAGFVYSRYGNPTVQAVESKIARIECGNEDGRAIMTSSGMAAISILIFTLVHKGDVCVTHNGLYGGSTEILEMLAEKIGFQLIFLDLNDPDELAEVQKYRSIRLIYFESPSNPLLHCIDIKQLTEFTRHQGIITICDNTICTPLLQTPLSLGVDYTVYSNTKYLSGHGNTISGCIVSKNKDFMDKNIRKSMRLIGGNCSPWEAWLTYTGMKTLSLRLQRQCANSTYLAAFLNDHPQVSLVNHNSLPSHIHHQLAQSQMSDFAPLMSFELKGGEEAVKTFMANIQIVRHAPTLGDLDTLVLHPYTSSHRNLPEEVKRKSGITPGLIRMSTGIEDPKDLRDDISRALQLQ